MRLINAQTQKLHNFASSAAVPPYAILSHTWGDSEVTFRELRNLSLSVQKTRERIRDKAGYYKIKKCCDQAIADGIQWVWVDTCCIDVSMHSPHRSVRPIYTGLYKTTRSQS
jgi:hypothetical protein